MSNIPYNNHFNYLFLYKKTNKIQNYNIFMINNKYLDFTKFDKIQSIICFSNINNISHILRFLKYFY